jgi:alginate O-acetyltransferase complex protein AlgI
LLILYKALPSIMHQEKWQNTKKFIQGVVFFHFTILGWLIFRAESLSQVGDMFSSLVFSFNLSLFAGSQFFKFLITIAPLLLIQIGQYKTNDLLFLYRRHWIIKTSTYAFMAYCTLGWGIMKAEEFIYFQF